MTIVVTGAEGFLGRRVVAALAGDGRSVIAVDRVPHAGESLRGVTYHQADLADASSLWPSSTISHQPFVLVHLAWDMRRQLGFPVQAEQVRQFAGLLDAWTGKGLQRLVAMGSAEEYGGANGLIREDTPPVLPLSPYGWAKRASHDLAASWSVKHRLPVVWLRPFIIYGPGQRGDMLVPYAVHCAAQRTRAEFSDGRQARDFVFIDDVADAIRRAATVETNGMIVCNLGRGEPVVVADVLLEIARRLDATEQFNLGARPRRPEEPDVQVADVSNAATFLGWRASVNWREGIRTVCDAATVRG